MMGGVYGFCGGKKTSELYFLLDTSVFNTVENRYKVTVRYYDGVKAGLYLNYTAESTGARAWQNTAMGGSGNWKTAEFLLDDVDLATPVNGRSAPYLFASTWVGGDVILTELTLEAVKP